MKKKIEHTNKANEDKPHFIREENVNEGWTVTPIGDKPGDPLPDDSDLFDDDDDDDPSFYTQEDYENCPILRRFLSDLGGDDPLADDDDE